MPLFILELCVLFVILLSAYEMVVGNTVTGYPGFRPNLLVSRHFDIMIMHCLSIELQIMLNNSKPSKYKMRSRELMRGMKGGSSRRVVECKCLFNWQFWTCSIVNGRSESAQIPGGLQWLPTVYVPKCPVEQYVVIVGKIVRPQDGPVLHCYKDVEVQSEVSLTPEGHIRVRVNLLSPQAVAPTKVTDNAPEIQLYSPRRYRVSSNTGLGIKMDISLDLPRGIYGHVTCHPESPISAIARLESAIIKPHSKDDIVLFVYNSNGSDCVIKQGDLLASVLVLQNYVPVLDFHRQGNWKCNRT